MKVEVKEKGNKIKFPCLMKEYEFGTIVLFNKDKCGVCIENGTSNSIIGEYSDYWDMYCFEPFDGEITLKND